MKECTNFCPPEFTGRWRDWHRGSGCSLDDGKPRTADGAAEIARLGHDHPAAGASTPTARIKVTRSCCGSTRPGPHADTCDREASEDVY